MVIIGLLNSSGMMMSEFEIWFSMLTVNSLNEAAHVKYFGVFAEKLAIE